ncbi:pilus assembly protein PilM [Aquisalimonas sp. APHAB1-3]|uniref:pilus assembly protein PilM n=1 Tax=unclassified Aquisalimonas TaxID=2644645 RepID=UPI0025BC9802|nr:pilus assembly protein PilM [Aquisalimonas sp.]
MGLFRKKSPPLLGIDISSSAVKLLELKRQDGRFRVESYAVEPLPSTAVVEKTIADIDAVSDAIKAAVKRSRTKVRTAALAVPASAAISKTISMPGDLGEQELEAQIELQADQYVPYPLDEVNLDFQIMGPSTDGAGMDVLLVASRSDNVDSRVDACEAAGLTPHIMDVESYATETAFDLIAGELPGKGKDQTIALLDVGAVMTTLTVFTNRQIIYTREQVFGGRQLTEEVQSRYGLTYDEASRAKRQGELPDGYQEEVLEPFKQAMAQQIVRSLQFFYGASQHNSVDALVLAGGCAGIPGAAELIQQESDVATYTANPFAGMAVASRIKKQRLNEDAPGLIIACGLAMRGFDA